MLKRGALQRYPRPSFELCRWVIRNTDLWMNPSWNLPVVNGQRVGSPEGTCQHSAWAAEEEKARGTYLTLLCVRLHVSRLSFHRPVKGKALNLKSPFFQSIINCRPDNQKVNLRPWHLCNFLPSYNRQYQNNSCIAGKAIYLSWLRLFHQKFIQPNYCYPVTILSITVPSSFGTDMLVMQRKFQPKTCRYKSFQWLQSPKKIHFSTFP